MKSLIDKYLDSKKRTWKASTIKNEMARLNSLIDSIDGNPEKLLDALASSAPYTRATSFRQVTAFWDWVIVNGFTPGPNLYKAWLTNNKRVFSNSYQKKRINQDLQDLLPIVSKNPLGVFLLTNGLRLSEALSYVPGSRQVIGKGSKLRAIFGPEPTTGFTNRDVMVLRELLKPHGLTPHDLRRLFATELLRKGLDLPSLMETMGWNSLETAQSYLQPLKHESIKEKVNEAIQISRGV